jgi:outer membrane protein OmpA-like peptidoglycan-associated protein
LAAGCSSTQVVLVPDPDGKVGEVTVMTGGGEQVLTQAGQSTEAPLSWLAPKTPETLSPADIQARFAVALRNEPAPPSRHLLYFHFDSVRLRPESARRLSGLVRVIQERDSCDISVNGHTDRLGPADFNDGLSLERALEIKKALIARGLPAHCVEVRYFGESDPLIATPDATGEPRNRRVEVEIR